MKASAVTIAPFLLPHFTFVQVKNVLHDQG